MLRRGMVGRRGPGLLGTVARTAVVAGTATATANAVSNRETRRAQAAADEQAQQPAQQPAQQQTTHDQPPSGQSPSGRSTQPSNGSDLTGKLQQLADLNASGALSDAEFAAAKSRLLGT
jgi:hypothetical protein